MTCLSCVCVCSELKVGQYLMVQVEEVKNDGRVVRLVANPSAVTKVCADTEHGWTLTNLLPGLLVRATIKKVTTAFVRSGIRCLVVRTRRRSFTTSVNVVLFLGAWQVTKHGLLLDFLSSFSGQVDVLHMEPTSSYTKGRQVTLTLHVQRRLSSLMSSVAFSSNFQLSVTVFFLPCAKRLNLNTVSLQGETQACC